MKDRYSKLAFLHRVNARKTPSFFSLKVAWYGKSLIGGGGGGGGEEESTVLVGVYGERPSNYCCVVCVEV